MAQGMGMVRHVVGERGSRRRLVAPAVLLLLVLPLEAHFGAAPSLGNGASLGVWRRAGMGNKLRVHWGRGGSSGPQRLPPMDGVAQRAFSLRLRGGFEKKTSVTYEGILSKLEVTEGDGFFWRKVKVILSDDLLRVHHMPNRTWDGKLVADPEIGMIKLEGAEFSPAGRPRLWGRENRGKAWESLYANMSMMEVSFDGSTIIFGAETVKERNKWLLALYQNRAILGSKILFHGKSGSKNREGRGNDGDKETTGPKGSGSRIVSSSMSHINQWGVSLISCGLSCFNPTSRPVGHEDATQRAKAAAGEGGNLQSHSDEKEEGARPGVAASVASESAAPVAFPPQSSLSTNHLPDDAAQRLIASDAAAQQASPGGGALEVDRDNDTSILGETLREEGKKTASASSSSSAAAAAAASASAAASAASAASGHSESATPSRSPKKQQQSQREGTPDADEALLEVSPAETVVVDATENHTATCIWLHSIGDTGEMHAELPESLGVPWCKFIFPTASVRPVTLHHGIMQPSWFDISSIDGDKGVVLDDAGVRESARRIMEFVEKEIESGIKPERIVLAGFGQGGAVALSAALRCKHRLAGVVSLSSWLAEGKDHGDILVNPYHVGMPALVCHGNADVFIPPKLGRQTKDILNSLGLQTAFKGYDMMGHAFCPKELVDVHKFMLQVLPKNESMPELPTWMETTVTVELDGMMGMRQRKTRSLVISEGSLQLYTIGQGTLLDSYDLLEFVAHSAQTRVDDYGIALTRKSVLDPSDEAGEEQLLFSFATEAERDGWLVAIGRWHQLLIARSGNLVAGSFGVMKTRDMFKDNQGSKKTILGGIVKGFGSLLWGGSGGADGYAAEPKRSKGPGWENLVFSGGGIKSMVHPAALGVIADTYGDDGRDLKWVKRVAGVSAGSVPAVLVACGLNVAQVQERASCLDLTKLNEGMSTIQGVRNMLGQYGAVDGTSLAELVDDLIFEWTGLRYATFQDLYDYSGILLKVFATSVRNGALIEFSAEKTPLDQIGRACQSSMAVPFLFQAVPTSDGDLLVDGGVIDNCPLWCFDEMPGVRNPKTLGFWISMSDDGQPQTATNLREYAMRMVELILYVEQFRAVEKEKRSEVIWIPAPDISLSTFSISEEDKRLMYECGAGAAARFLRPYKVWEAKYGTWPSPAALSKELEVSAYQSLHTTADSLAAPKKSTSAMVMRWLAGDSGGARYDKIKRFVRTWLTERRRLTRLIRDTLGPKKDGYAPQTTNAIDIPRCTSSDLRELEGDMKFPLGPYR